jgi:hypothetical protein
VVRPASVALRLLAAVAVAGCGATASPSPSPSRPPDPSATASPSASVAIPDPPSQGPTPTPTETPSPTPSPTRSPTPTPVPTATPEPTPPTLDAFWSAVRSGIERHGRLRIRVIGPAPGELRYELDASATVIDGTVVFVCVDEGAFDGQSGFEALPGAWSCGVAALQQGLRTTGQPLDAWSDELPEDDGIRETVVRTADGLWQWDYRAINPFAGGEVRTRIVVDPADGEIRSGSRSDPIGDTTYGISYAETFPPIALP